MFPEGEDSQLCSMSLKRMDKMKTEPATEFREMEIVGDIDKNRFNSGVG